MIIGGVAVWCLVAVLVAVVVGRTIAQRDRQRSQHPSVELPGQRHAAPDPEPGRASLTDRLLRRR